MEICTGVVLFYLCLFLISVQQFLDILMADKSSVDKFYLTQNISIRRAIREMDIYQTQQIFNDHTKKLQAKQDINLLVVGPDNSGKSSFLKTMYYALNGTLNYTKQCLQTGNIIYEKIDIKKNKKSTVRGCSQINEVDHKIGISAIQVRNKYQQKASYEKYTKACELLHGKMLGCIRQIKLDNFQNIGAVIICISIVDKFLKQDVMGLRFLVAELQQKQIPYYIVGTKIDVILGNKQTIQEAQTEKLEYIESWKNFIVQELHCQKAQIYFMQNYIATSKQNLENSQTINFYSLKLLQTVVSQANSFSPPKDDRHLLTFRTWSCSC